MLSPNYSFWAFTHLALSKKLSIICCISWSANDNFFNSAFYLCSGFHPRDTHSSGVHCRPVYYLYTYYCGKRMCWLHKGLKMREIIHDIKLASYSALLYKKKSRSGHVFYNRTKWYNTCSLSILRRAVKSQNVYYSMARGSPLQSKTTELSPSMTLMDVVGWLPNIVGQSRMCYQQFNHRSQTYHPMGCNEKS